jgi:hypothetical protein
MARNFIDQEDKSDRLGYTDGFRFGFGFFIANLVGITVLAALAAAVNYALQRLH